MIETQYVNQFTSVRTDPGNPVKVSTNNIYLGSERIISDVTASDGANTPVDFTMYYHTDHLGSTGFLTDATGAVNEHVEYTAWGETWLEKNIQLTYNGSEVNIPKYMYTSKELDTQTHLYYFGARYYDPKTSLWVSTDPILALYLLGEINSGVNNSKNLNVYSYVFSNPLSLIDRFGLSASNPVDPYPETNEPGFMFDAEENICADMFLLRNACLRGQCETPKDNIGEAVIDWKMRTAGRTIESIIPFMNYDPGTNEFNFGLNLSTNITILEQGDKLAKALGMGGKIMSISSELFSELSKTVMAVQLGFTGIFALMEYGETMTTYNSNAHATQYMYDSLYRERHKAIKQVEEDFYNKYYHINIGVGNE